MSSRTCELLPWDSEFFDYRIARLILETVDAPSIDAAEGWCREERIDCLYLLLASMTAAQHEMLLKRGFFPCDERVTLERTVPDAPPMTSAVRIAEPTDIPALRHVAATSHINTRFYADPRFRPAAGKLYAFWIEKSIHDEATTVFVPNDSLASGYITCYGVDQGVGQIGLLGVDAAARGRGIGRRLVDAALAWSGSRRQSRMRVVTQGANDTAVKLYERCGFVHVRSEWWYHRWFTGGAVRDL